MKELDFFDQWALYNKILEKDYMFHSEIFRKIQEIIDSHISNTKFKILDIGCGEAFGIHKFLDKTNLENYFGIDKSQTALSWAERNLQKCNLKFSLLQSDFVQSLEEIPGGFDVILCGYSVHHLKAFGDKKRFLDNLIRKLNPGNILIFFDLIQKEEETLSQYHTRYINFCKTKWKLMTTSEIEEISTHIQNNDFPLTPAKWQEAFCPRVNNLQVISFDHQNPYYLLMGFQKKLN